VIVVTLDNLDTGILLLWPQLVSTHHLIEAIVNYRFELVVNHEFSELVVSDQFSELVVNYQMGTTTTLILSIVL
jgi:hypothetical protein